MIESYNKLVAQAYHTRHMLCTILDSHYFCLAMACILVAYGGLYRIPLIAVLHVPDYCHHARVWYGDRNGDRLATVYIAGSE